MILCCFLFFVIWEINQIETDIVCHNYFYFVDLLRIVWGSIYVIIVPFFVSQFLQSNGYGTLFIKVIFLFTAN